MFVSGWSYLVSESGLATSWMSYPLTLASGSLFIHSFIQEMIVFECCNFFSSVGATPLASIFSPSL